MSSIGKGAVNIAFRLFTLGGKFLLLILMARKLPLSELGLYGLITATITFAIYFVGMDFYTFNIRDMLAKPQSEWGKLLRDQLAFHLIMYMVAFPFLLAVFFAGILDWQYFVWFCCLLVLEHLGQEAYRVIEASGRPTTALAYLFIRSGIWPYMAIALLILVSNRGINLVFGSWLAGSLLGLFVAIFLLRGLGWREGWQKRIDWMRIWNGVKVAIVLLLSTLFLRAMMLVDRYILERYWSLEIVGVYTFFFSIAFILQDFVNVGVVTSIYPRLISSFQRGELGLYNQLYIMLAKRIVITAILLGLSFSLVLPLLLPFVGRVELLDHLPVFWLLLLATFLSILGLIPFYALYAHSADLAISISSFLSLITCFSMSLLLVPTHGPIGAAIAYVIAMAVLTLVRFIFVLSVDNASIRFLVFLK